MGGMRVPEIASGKSTRGGYRRRYVTPGADWTLARWEASTSFRFTVVAPGGSRCWRREKGRLSHFISHPARAQVQALGEPATIGLVSEVVPVQIERMRELSAFARA